MFCRFCGKEIEDNSIYCKCCGKKLVEEKTSQLYKKVKCTKCGALLYVENDESELDCQFCGNKNLLHNEEISQTIKQEDNNEDEEENVNAGGKLLLVFLLILFIVFIPVAIIYNIDNNNYYSCSNAYDKNITVSGNILEQNITSSDYSLTKQQDLTAYLIMATPKTNIKEMTIELKLYNKNDQLVYSDTITKYNLSKNSTYTFKFDYGFTSSLTGSYVKYNITGKK